MNILLVEVFVLTTIGWTTTLYWLTRRWLRQRIAWQWWQQQQSLQRHHTAESIRDGLLQQTFGFRYYLESTAAQENEPATADQAAQWLTRMQALYESLESLSNELSPPFVEDSLPLALQFAVKHGHWRRSATAPLAAAADLPSAPQAQLHLPESWPYNSPQQNQVVLSVTMELLAMMSDRPDQTLRIALQTESSLHTLTIETTDYCQSQTITHSAELRHLKEIFHSLAAGRLEMSQVGKALIGRLSWPIH